MLLIIKNGRKKQISAITKSHHKTKTSLLLNLLRETQTRAETFVSVTAAKLYWKHATVQIPDRESSGNAQMRKNPT